MITIDNVKVGFEKRVLETGWGGARLLPACLELRLDQRNQLCGWRRERRHRRQHRQHTDAGQVPRVLKDVHSSWRRVTNGMSESKACLDL